MIFGGIVVVFGSLFYLSVDLCACLKVYIDCRWNCVRVQQFIMIDGKMVVVFISLH